MALGPVGLGRCFERLERQCATFQEPLISKPAPNGSSQLMRFTSDSGYGEVGYLVRVLNVLDVSGAEQTFKVNMISMTYKNFARETNGPFISNVQNNAHNLPTGACSWRHVKSELPPVKLSNAVSVQYRRQLAWITPSDDWSRLRVTWEQWMVAEFKDSMAPRNFPFDWQYFRIMADIEPNRKCANPVLRGAVLRDRLPEEHGLPKQDLMKKIYRRDPPDAELWRYYYKHKDAVLQTSSWMQSENLVPEWKFYTSRDEDRARESTCPSGHWLSTDASNEEGWKASLQFTFYARRNPGYYIWSALGVVTIMEFMALYSFANPREELGDRQQWNITLLLSVFALKFSVAGTVPQVPFLTMYDKKLVLAFATIFLVTTSQHLSVLLQHGEEIERLAPAVSAGWVILQNSAYWAQACRLIHCRPRRDLVHPGG